MATASPVVSLERTSLLHIARTTVAALASQLIAAGLHMPEPYWATVTTIVVMQSSLGAAGRYRGSASRERHWERWWEGCWLFILAET